jgi:secondary thiamine-phosphate synthase enzyme
MIQQYEITLPAYERGFHLVTREIFSKLNDLPETGLVHIFIRHTSAGLAINENADPTVRMDFETVFNKLVPEGWKYVHDDEGPDDMPAHIKATLTGSSVSVPLREGKPHLGTWQGIYLCEFRNDGARRKLTVTVIS